MHSTNPFAPSPAEPCTSGYNISFKYTDSANREQTASRDLASLPEISSFAIRLLEKNEVEEGKLQSFDPSKEIKTLDDLSEKLENAREHTTRDAILGIFKAVLYVGIIAAAVIGSMTLMSVCSIAVPFVSIAAAMAVGSLATWYGKQIDWGTGESNQWIIPMMLAAPFIALYEGFAKPTLIEKQIEAHKEKIGNMMSSLQEVKFNIAAIDPNAKKAFSSEENNKFDALKKFMTAPADEF